MYGKYRPEYHAAFVNTPKESSTVECGRNSVLSICPPTVLRDRKGKDQGVPPSRNAKLNPRRHKPLLAQTLTATQPYHKPSVSIHQIPIHNPPIAPPPAFHSAAPLSASVSNSRNSLPQLRPQPPNLPPESPILLPKPLPLLLRLLKPPSHLLDPVATLDSPQHPR